MTKATLVCKECGHEARRKLDPHGVASRGVHEAACLPALCPNGHGPMVRKDGGRVARRPAR